MEQESESDIPDGQAKIRQRKSRLRAFATGLLVLATACGEPTGRWSGTEWWASYAGLPEWEMTAVSAGALDETMQPFPAVRRVSVSPGGRVAVVQEGVPAAWLYDARGRSLGRVGRSEIMDLRGRERSRVWAERAGWLSGDRLWIAERGGDIAVFSRDLAFSDVWEIAGEASPLAVNQDERGLSALVLVSDAGGSVLQSVTRAGRTTELSRLAAADTVVACAEGECHVVLRADGDTGGVEVLGYGLADDASMSSFRVPPAPDGTRPSEAEPLPAPVATFFIDDEQRTWLGLAPDDSGRAYWLILDRSGLAIGRFHLADDQVGLLAAAGVFWASRETDGVTWLHRYEFASP